MHESCNDCWQVFDVRAGPRLLHTVPFRPGPGLLSFHPKFSSTLLIASQSGIFTLSDIQGSTNGPTYQVSTPAVVCFIDLVDSFVPFSDTDYMAQYP